MFWQKYEDGDGISCIKVTGLGKYSLKDTLECGQCFRHRLISDEDGEVKYMTVVGEELVFVSQRTEGELIFRGTTEEVFLSRLVTYFSLESDLEFIKRDVISHTDSEWLKCAAERGEGIAILKQDEWEALFSFIVSQNNNIPRIKKIIGQISAAYGVNLCLQKGIKKCPLSKIEGTPCDENCKECGACYTFPTALDVISNPERLLPSHPGFRYKYLIDAAERVASGMTDLKRIAERKSYSYTLSELTKILGVGNKVASCAALFGFGNLEAFPIDVWMKRAIDEYFGGKLDPLTLGKYAGIAQQYIFHYIRENG